MRDIGYSLETAVADIIDNSISASASKVEIWFDPSEDCPISSIVDNGNGMTEDELLEAMKPGSRNPRSERKKDDLGRFGLGLKTASFSQCKKLTVLSRKNGIFSGAIWDLTLVSERDDWIVVVLDQEEIEKTPYSEKLSGDGTIVLWEMLDRLCETGVETINESLVYEKLDLVGKHLSLVFHRFLSGDIKGRRLEIFINGHQIEAFDPFCLKSKATQLLNQEIVRIEGNEIEIQPYILPHHSKLTQKEYDFYKNRSDFVNNQGVYVYRNGRLMAWGNWFRLVAKGEATKLARVKIDFPNALDEHWTIDIKKSRAHPPYQVREKLKQIIDRITEQSTRVHAGRGRRLLEAVSVPLWLRYPEHDGIRYSLNREHPMIKAYNNSLRGDDRPKFKEVISTIENSVPVEAIYSDYSMSPRDFDFLPILPQGKIDEKLETLYKILSAETEFDIGRFKEIVMSLKPFSDHQEEVDNYIRRELDV